MTPESQKDAVSLALKMEEGAPEPRSVGDL